MEQNDDAEQKPIKIFVIKRKNCKNMTKRTQRDHEETILRRKKTGPLYDKIFRTLNSLFLGSAKQRQLLNIAYILGSKYNIAIDRLTKRSFECLVCWYCENWDTISFDVVVYSNDLLQLSNSSLFKYNNVNIETSVSSNIQREMPIAQMNNISTTVQPGSASPHLFTPDTNLIDQATTQQKNNFLPIPTSQFPPITDLFVKLQKEDQKQNNNAMIIQNIVNNDNNMEPNKFGITQNNEAEQAHVMRKPRIIRHVIPNDFFTKNINQEIKNGNSKCLDENKIPYMPHRFRDYI